MKNKSIILESPVYTLEAALRADEFGVDRLELCADYGEGGATPSLGLLQIIKQQVSLPVFVMIRPRGGDFVYSELELEVMKADIRQFGQHGADGFVFGVLDIDGKVNETACKEMMAVANGKPCTFHRAFDLIGDQEEALESLVRLGFERVLTSGAANAVGDGLDQLGKLLSQARGRITVMPGGGLKPEHLQFLNQEKLLKEIHASCKGTRAQLLQNLATKVKLTLLPEMEGKVLTLEKQKVLEFRKAILNLKVIEP